MPEITVQAIVLRRRDSGESDRRLTLLTRERGKLDAVAKGARKAGSRLAGSSDPLVAARLSLATGRRNLFVTQTQPVTSFPGLRSDFDRLSAALALTELIAAVLPYEQPDPDAYDFLLRALGALERHERPAVALVWAELALMRSEGFLPQFGRSASTGAEIKEPQPWVSPQGGGYVSDEDAGRYGDRFRTRPEVLYGLARTSELDDPPGNLRLAEECLAVLLPFWRQIAEAPLPANEAFVNEVRHRAGVTTPS